ncbi:hypothetical protein N657DRAFT_374084 [Parathielavia appendiculata]|uniref:Uncharacterized protein n=1 Tax=Parathielavia appendiculata TaxID=2587402 RepID=A0AAN6YYM8_9PEZI|nr:hypothetical protein N657DRAFT_374084 [Parathielavia appendiculata]
MGQRAKQRRCETELGEHRFCSTALGCSRRLVCYRYMRPRFPKPGHWLTQVDWPWQLRRITPKGPYFDLTCQKRRSGCSAPMSGERNKRARRPATAWSEGGVEAGSTDSERLRQREMCENVALKSERAVAGTNWPTGTELGWVSGPLSVRHVAPGDKHGGRFP